MSQIRLSVRWENVLLATLASISLAFCGVASASASASGTPTPAGTKLTSVAQVVYADYGLRSVSSKPVTLTVASVASTGIHLPVAAATVRGTQAFPCTLTNTGNSVSDLRVMVTMTANTYAYIVEDVNEDGVWQSSENTILRSVPSLVPGNSIDCFLVVQAMPGVRDGAVGGVTVFVAPAGETEFQVSACFTPTFAAPRFSPAFTFEAPERITSSPIVRNGLVLVGTESGILYAVRTQGAQAGTVAWRFPVTGSLGAPIRGRVAHDGECFYMAADNGVFYKLDARGQMMWSAPVAPAGSLMQAMPVVHESTVTLACGDGRVRELSAQTGEVLSASCSVGAGALGTPSMPTRNALWVGGSDGYLYNMRADHAFTILSAYPISAEPMSATPFVDSRTGIVVSVSAEGSVYAMKMHSDAMVWGPVSLGSAVKSSPYVDSDSGIAYFTTTNGWLHALRIADGGKVSGYPVRLSETGELANSPVVAPLGDDTTIFVGSTSGSFYAVRAAQPDRVARYDTGDSTARFLGAPALSGPTLDDVVVATANRKLYGFQVRDAVANQ